MQIWHKNTQAIIFDCVIGTEKKKIAVNILSQLHEKRLTMRLRSVLKRFSTNSGIQRAMSAFFRKLLSTGFGKSIKLFQKWQILPERTDNEMMRMCNQFERGLFSHAIRRIKSGFDPLKENLLLGRSRKIGALQHLLRVTMSSEKRMFQRWYSHTKTIKEITICRQTIELFEHL